MTKLKRFNKTRAERSDFIDKDIVVFLYQQLKFLDTFSNDKVWEPIHFPIILYVCRVVKI